MYCSLSLQHQNCLLAVLLVYPFIVTLEIFLKSKCGHLSLHLTSCKNSTYSANIPSLNRTKLKLFMVSTYPLAFSVSIPRMQAWEQRLFEGTLAPSFCLVNLANLSLLRHCFLPLESNCNCCVFCLPLSRLLLLEYRNFITFKSL